MRGLEGRREGGERGEERRRRVDLKEAGNPARLKALEPLSAKGGRLEVLTPTTGVNPDPLIACHRLDR